MVDYQSIILSNGKVTIVDRDDYSYLSQWSWSYSNGYVRRTDKSTSIFLHRLIMEANKGNEIDHINGNKLDNRKVNLRFCNRSQNNANRIKRIGIAYSDYKGVTYDKKLNKWKAQISLGGKNKYLGNYSKDIYAAKVYNKAALEAYGEFANLNVLEIVC